jgi:hypothetical protein
MFLQAVPKFDKFRLSNLQFCTAIRFRYQFPMARHRSGMRCTCKVGNDYVVIDSKGHHILTGCTQNGSKRITLHNAIVHSINNCLKYCGCWTQLEERAFPGHDAKPDISIRHPIHSNKNDLFLDVSIATPYIGIQRGRTEPPLLNRQPDMAAVKTKLRAAKSRYSQKITKYAPFMQTRPDAEFLPFVFETSGAIHADATQLLSKYANHAADIKKIPQAIIYDYFLKIVSVAFQRNLADSICSRLHNLSSKTPMEIVHPEFNPNNILAQTISN